MNEYPMPKNFSYNNLDFEHFKAFFECSTMGMILTNGDGKIITINPSALGEFGYSQKDLVGKKIELLIPERFHKEQLQYRNECAENLKNGMEQRLIIYGMRSDGTEFPAEISLGSYTSDGSAYVVLYINNISIRKAAESELEKLKSDLENTVMIRTKELQQTMAQLEKSNAELENVLSFKKALLDTAGAMIIATDEKGIINLINPETASMLGYSQQEIINKATPLIFHDKKEMERKKQKLVKEFGIKAPNNFDVLVERARRNIHDEEQYSYIDKSGKSFPVSLTVTALRNTKGDITGFMGVAVDISERIRIEKELKRTEHLFLQLLNNYPDGIICIIDRNYHFVYTGGELHKQLHADIRMLIGKKIFPFFSESLRQSILQLLAEVFQDKINIMGFELPHLIANGIYIMDAFPLPEEDGTVNNVGVIIKNISKLKEAEKRLIEDLRIARDLNELKSRFVSMASHEFRTPLSTVLSSAYLIEKYTSETDQPKREKHLQRIVSSVNMLTDILNDFLSLGKIEEGKLKAKYSEFDLQEMLEGTIDEIKNNLKENQQICYDHTGNPNVYLDPSFLKHIIMNLVSNASKFSTENSEIDIKTIHDNSQVILTVKDQGIGISKEDQKHLIERFFRAENAQNIQGTGLGLYIVSRYAELMNGDLQFKSELGKGTEFTITFKPV